MKTPLLDAFRDTARDLANETDRMIEQCARLRNRAYDMMAAANSARRQDRIPPAKKPPARSVGSTGWLDPKKRGTRRKTKKGASA